MSLIQLVQDTLTKTCYPQSKVSCIDFVGASRYELNPLLWLAPPSSSSTLPPLTIRLIGPALVSVTDRERKALQEQTPESLQFTFVACAFTPACPPAPLAILCNAGLWGYDSWRDTCQALWHARTLAVVTAYSLEESIDDFDVLEEWNITHFLWEPTVCPSASKDIEPWSKDTPQRSNAAWLSFHNTPT